MQFQRFGFDRVFAEPHPEPAVAAGDLVMDIAALRAELAALKADYLDDVARARAEGYEAGIAQARGEREVAILSAVDALHAGLESLDERFGETEARLTSDAAQVALAAGELLAARTLAMDPAAAIDDAIGRTLRQVARGTELFVRVHPELAETIEARIAERQSRDRRRLNLTVCADAAVVLGDAQISWDQGSLVLDMAERRREIAAELETLLPG